MVRSRTNFDTFMVIFLKTLGTQYKKNKIDKFNGTDARAKTKFHFASGVSQLPLSSTTKTVATLEMAAIYVAHIRFT